MRILYSVLMISLLCIIIGGCSNSNSNPTQPDVALNQSGAGVLFSGSFEIDLESRSIILSETRQTDLVYDITGFLPDKCPGGCFRFAIINVVGTVLEIELTIENPLAIQVYDVRIIYTNLFGKTVTNPDSYTDFLGTPVTTIYPFTAFAKEFGARAFPAGPGGIDTETLFLDFPPGAQSSVNYSIIASLPANVGEPFEISGMNQDGTLTPSGGSATISCIVSDHQNDVSAVYLDSTPFTGNAVELLPSAGLFEAVISNTIGAPIGTYNQLIMALSPNVQNISTYNYVQITVSDDTTDVIYVDDSNTTGIEDGTQTNPYNTITEGVNAATAGYQVWVDDSGNDYNGPVSTKADVILRSVNWDASDGGNQAAIYGTSGNIVNVIAYSTIDGFKIHGTSSSGVYVNGAEAVMKNCLITGIKGSSGIVTVVRVNDAPGALIENCDITDSELNTVTGGILNCMYVYNSPCTIRGNRIYNNRKTEDAGIINVMYCTGCSPQLGYNLEIYQNQIYDIDFQSSGFINGIYVSNGTSDAEIHNNLLYDFDMISGGMAIGMYFSNVQNINIANNVFHDFQNNTWCTGMYVDEDSTNLAAYNNIVSYMHNSSGNPVGWAVYFSTSNISWDYNDVYQVGSTTVPAGVGNIFVDPEFVNPGSDFHLDTGSPCIDTGDPAIFDPDNSRSDMGCYGGPDGNW